MANTYWKSGTKNGQRARLELPSLGQLGAQLGLVGLVVAVWGGLLFGFLRLTGPPPAEETPAAPVAAVAEATPTAPAPTATPEPSPSPIATAAPTEAPAADPPAAVEADPNQPEPTSTAPEPTATPEPSPTATEPPAEPTEEPAPEEEAAAPAAEGSPVSFANDVFPIIDRRCVKCHGGPDDEGGLRIEEGLDMRTYEGILAGSYNGPVVEPGNVEDSYLIEQIVTGEMPKKEPRLLPGEVRTLSEWVAAGAPNN